MIFVEDNSIKINGVVVPGLVKSIEVKESAKIDEQDVQGSSTKSKQATGYEDPKITIDLIIDDTPTQTKYQRLAVARSLFRRPGQTVPQPIPIVCEDTAVRGIDKVLFKDLTHKGESKRGYLSATLELWGYVPQTITAQKSSASGSTGSASSAGSAITEEYGAYLTTNRGKSPAVDSADSTAALSAIAQMPY